MSPHFLLSSLPFWIDFLSAYVSSSFFVHCFSVGILQVIYWDFLISLYTTSLKHLIYCHGFIHQCSDSQEGRGVYLEPMSVRLSDLGTPPSIFLCFSLLLMTQKKRWFYMLFSSAQFPEQKPVVFNFTFSINPILSPISYMCCQPFPLTLNLSLPAVTTLVQLLSSLL